MATRIPTQAEYEHREAVEFHRQLKDAEKGTLSERRHAAMQFAEHLAHDPALVAERIGWLVDGNYGYGAYKAAERVLAGRGNKEAWLVQTIGALEWQVPPRMTVQIWKKLSPAQREKLHKAIVKELR